MGTVCKHTRNPGGLSRQLQVYPTQKHTQGAFHVDHEYSRVHIPMCIRIPPQTVSETPSTLPQTSALGSPGDGSLEHLPRLSGPSRHYQELACRRQEHVLRETALWKAGIELQKTTILP